MHAVELIAPAIGVEPGLATVEGICAVTGGFGPCVPRKDLLGKSFTNLDILAAPSSQYVSTAAYTALTYKWERMGSWYCDGKEFRRLDRQGVREMVISGKYSAPWAGYATTSYKKHGSLWTPVNTTGAIWRFEGLTVNCTDRGKMLEIWDRLNSELRAGIGRSILESLECPSFVLKLIGVERWFSFERWARPRYQGGLYKFMCYLLPSQEELRNERAGTTT